MTMHTASRKNPPAEALAQAGRESRRAYEREWHIWTETEIDDFMFDWGTSGTTPVRIALNVQQVEAAAGRDVSMETIADLARAIQRYGDERAESAIERYQEQGE